MTEFNSGIRTHGEANDWKIIERQTNGTICKIMDIVKTKYCGITLPFAEQKDVDISLYIYEFTKFLESKSGLLKREFIYPFSKDEIDKFTVSNSSFNKNKKGKNTIIEDTVLKTNIRKINEDFEVMSIDDINLSPIESNNYKFIISKFFYVLYWSLNILVAVNTGKSFNNDNFLNAVISLSRMIDDNINLDVKLINVCNSILVNLKDKLVIKLRSEEKIYENMFKNQKLIVESFWDITKPKSIDLYDEQKRIIEDTYNAMVTNTPMVRFYKVPPGSGKTFIAAPLSVVIDSYNPSTSSRYVKCSSIVEKKYLLYICYNSIVRNDVALLCNSVNVDIPFWTATTMSFNGKIDTLLRPFKNCFLDFKKSRRDKENRARFGSIETQWNYFMTETDYKPKIIISDLMSAYNLMVEYPNRFIPYFDEAFAGADQDITIKILKILPKISILVSATLPEINEVPSFIDNFINRYRDEIKNPDNVFDVVTSNKQHLSCTFVGPDGNVYLPHYCVKLDKLSEYIDIILNDPIKMRAYSPEVVYNMVKGTPGFEELLPEELKFKNRIPNYGNIKHEELRFYAIDILRYIAETNNEVMFDILCKNKTRKFFNIDISKIFTSNSPNYRDGTTLHVSSYNNFGRYCNSLLEPLYLGNDINMAKVITSYEAMLKLKEDKIESMKRGITKENKERIEYEIENLTQQPVRVRWPQKYIPNTFEHSEIHGYTFDNNPSSGLNINVTKFANVDEMFAKGLMSGIGLYNPDEMNTAEKSLFMEYKDNLNFIISTPSIIYGTNMNISIVDIGEEYSSYSTRNSLFQLVGRAGRKGKKSYSAMVIFRTWEMLDKIMAPTFRNIEAEIIEEQFNSL